MVKGKSNMKILCIGSINQDIVYTVEHIAAGGETVLSRDRNVYWGGKGLNQAVALARSFDEVYFAGMVNQNECAIQDYFKSNHVKTDYMEYSEIPTGHAIIYVDCNGQNSITVFGGANQALTETYIEETLNHFEKGDIVLIQNETNQLEKIICYAHERQLTIAMNPSPFEEKLLGLPLEMVDLFILNEIEGAQLTGCREPDAIIRAALKKFPDAVFVLTLGEQGSIYADKKNILRQGIYKMPVTDTTAAGDTFTGYFLSGTARGLSAEDALKLAAKASAIAISRQGAAVSIPKLDEVLKFDKS